MKIILVATLVFGTATAVRAGEVENTVSGEEWSPNLDACVTSVDDRLFELSYNPDDDETFQNSSLREILIAGWGAITCPGEMTLRSLAPDLLPNERENYCLVYSKERKTYLGYAQGRKDTYWRCKDSVDFQKADIAPLASFVFPDSQTASSNSIARCTTLVSGKSYRLTYDLDDEELFSNMTFRDALIGGDCPGQAVLSALLPELSPSERSAFCLVYDDEAEEYVGYAEGERDAYLRCKEPSVPICERVNATKEEALAIVGLGAGATAGASAAASAAGVAAVGHSSGAVILTGSSGYIAGTIGTVGTSLLAILTAPATLTAAAVSVVAVGGAVYVCQSDSDDQK
ncbi:hypothetical protein [Sedimentitalea todarodis]|uniref:Uncharacterized protein n=1 Tax=Sedimentitalea todarodis TaxID=1631240 RepID=A0ABU3VDM3_9RHOB|nr:hypothetical protein [Sedimentitalea todarodis]MDU9004279.1 hypothetical protein [Sedimentitalea todarodis]